MTIKKILIYLVKPTLLNGNGWNPFKYSFQTLKHLRKQYSQLEEKEKEKEITEGLISFELVVKENELTAEMLEEKYYKHLSVASLQFVIAFAFASYALMSIFLLDGTADNIFFRGVGLLGVISLFFISFCMSSLVIKNLHYSKQIKCRELFPISVFLKRTENWNPLTTKLKR